MRPIGAAPTAGREVDLLGTVTANGITMGYDDVGEGDPLVLVHGHPFDRSMWAPQVAEFAGAGWRVITADLRGYGETAVVAGITPLETFARDIAALLDCLEVHRVALGGLSMGGQIVLEFYRLFPDRVRGLVLADTFAQAETEDGKKVRNDLADRLLREGMGGYAAQVLPKMVAPYNVRALPAVAEHVLAMMCGTPPEGAAAALRGRAERPDYTGLLAGISVPTLVVVGQDDEFTPVGDAEFMYQRIPGATLAVIEGAAHMPNMERPAEFNRALRQFLAGLMTGGMTSPRRRAEMFVGAEHDRRFSARATGDERSMLVEFLGSQRATLELKCTGLDVELSRRSVEPSTLSLLGLVRHLADVERRWFRRVMAGQDAPPLFSSEANPDQDFDGAVPDPAVVAEAWEAWRAEVAFADGFVTDAPDLDIVGDDSWRGTVSLRWVLIHMVEEYARHNGHADLLRERIDGAIGL
jgi:3-oxoadipate enol-lactonase